MTKILYQHENWLAEIRGILSSERLKLSLTTKIGSELTDLKEALDNFEKEQNENNLSKIVTSMEALNKKVNNIQAQAIKIRRLQKISDEMYEHIKTLRNQK